MRSRWALITLLALPGLARAQSQPSPRQAATFFERILESGAVGKADELMTDGLMQYLSNESSQARKVCTAAAQHVRKTARSAADDWKSLVAKLIKVGEWCTGAGDKDADAFAALAEAYLCRARLNDDPTANPGPEDWSKAADLYLKVDGINPEEGKAIARAVRILREGASSGGGANATLHERANALLEQGAKKYPTNDYFRTVRHLAKLEQIDGLVKTDRKRAKQLLEDYLKQLEPQALNPRAFSPTLYNDAVSFALKHKKLGVKGHFRTLRGAYKCIEFEYPEGDRWKKKGNDLFQYDTEGQLMRMITFDTYRWDTNYIIEGRSYGGDNLKGLARGGEIDVMSVIEKVVDRKSLRRKRLNRHIPQCQAFSIGGLDDEGQFLRFNYFYFKAKKTKLTSISVLILDWGDQKRRDPEAEFVIDSIREP